MKATGMRAIGRMGVAAAVMAMGAAARANNLQIENVTVIAQNATTAFVQFDISWENSWRYASGGDPLYFHDAAWVFFKVQKQGETTWNHVKLEGTGTNPTGYATGSGSTPIEMVVPADRVGMFVRRSADGAGTTSAQSVKAVWNIASNSLVKADQVKIQAFGVEMVYVAAGSFRAGSGGAEANRFYAGGTTNDPFMIASEGAITVGTASGNLYYRNDGGGVPGDQVGPIPAAFPKGYAAFYSMKYSITEGQWVDFFNSLTAAQKTNRDITGYPATYLGKNSDGVVNRNTVAWTSGDATSAARDRACNFLAWSDGAAFADWAGLRPMTELEYEKACRGQLAPVANEYAWGNTTISATTAIVDDGTGTDMATGGNCNYSSSSPDDGPYRVGIYATGSSTREQAGASYWGIMELSGNLWERAVTVGHTTGRAFTGLHGNGVLTVDGYADVANWPPNSTANGAGLRGGQYSGPADNARVSDRVIAAVAGVPHRANDLGWRGVRSAP